MTDAGPRTGCYEELTYATYVDRELPAAEARAVEEHLAECARCRGLVAALAEETRVLVAALAPEPEAAALPGAAPAGDPAPATERVAGAGGAPAGHAGPAWRRAAGWTGLAVAGLGLALELGRGRWGEDAVDGWTLGIEAAVFLVRHGGILGRAVEGLALLSMAALGLIGLALVLRRAPAAPVLRLLGLAPAVALGLGALVGPGGAHALETRTGPDASVGPGERVTGTLVASGDRVVVQGVIDGDLIAAARTIVIQGTVTGDAILGGLEVDVRGAVEGNLYVTARRVALPGRVGRSVYGLARHTAVEADGRVTGDLTVAGRDVQIEGPVGRDLWLFAEQARVAAAVGRHVLARAGRVEVAAPARVGGDLRIVVADREAARVEAAVPVAGRRGIETAPQAHRLLAGPRGVFWLATGFFGAVLFGALALGILPGFFQASVDGVAAWGRSLGLGAAVLVGGPVAIVLVGLTLVGLPVALAALAAFLLGLYAAKIVVGAYLGRRLLRVRGTGFRESLGALVAGVVLLTLLFELPVVGGLARVAVLCLGLGAVARHVARLARPARA